MGRSVSIPSGAMLGVFIDVSEYDTDTWDDFLDDVREVNWERYPSFVDADAWQDREDHIVAENPYARIVVSEYMGLACVSLVTRDENPLSDSWCRRVCVKWREHLEKRYAGIVYRRSGAMSNGEGVYHKV